MEIKGVNSIQIEDTEICEYLSFEIEDIINETKELLNENLVRISKEVEKNSGDNYILMPNKSVYYSKKLNIIFPDFQKYECSTMDTYYTVEGDEGKIDFSGFKGEIIKISELQELERSFPQFSALKDEYEGFTVNDGIYKWCKRSDLTKFETFKKYYHLSTCNIPVYRLEKTSELEKWIKNQLIPNFIDEILYISYIEILNYYNEGLIEFDELGFIHFKIKDICNRIINNNETIKINNRDINKEIVLSSLNNKNSVKVNDIFKVGFHNKLLNCETVRADIEAYDEKILSDPNRGHWDLWDIKKEGKFTVNFNEELVARNPLLDIKEDGVIGIDFGTKSTVVVFQENGAYTLPMRIGMGMYSKKVQAKHYENPTVMELIDLESFLTNYKEKKGRPNTKWSDLTVSHTAFNSFMNSNSENYYSYISELKQWAGIKGKKIRIKDKKNSEITLKSYVDLDPDTEFDPIEIYAYYIGLYINNMRNGIYLDYILSFPVTYEKVIRDKIIESFKRGLKKSIPSILQENEDLMSRFRVSVGASEPAAYAICALEEFGFEPKLDEKIFYGVFDFGGGTTDFDFGVFREAKGNESRRFDYVIEHFGAGGDRYLGGENLLELLSYEVFKNNQDKLRECGIMFTKPEESKKFLGSEVLISNSQEARLNTMQLMEKLRPLWEDTENNREIYVNNIIILNLFNKEGDIVLNFELNIDLENLERILYNRIEKGVINFFEALRLSFKDKEAEGIKSINILLAGNSSKSRFVTEIFNKYIDLELKSANRNESIENKYFKLYPPLGSKLAYEIQQENGKILQEDKLESPTGKTGVAFGLIKCRKGGRIKVIDRNVDECEIRPIYYLGYERKGKLEVVIDKSIKYNEWKLFVDAAYEDFEVYYTNLPKATTNKLDINEVLRKKCRISQTSDTGYVYIRFVEPSVIEYVVAEEDGIKEEKYLSDIIKVSLGV